MPSAAENVKKTSVENERLCKARAKAKFTWIMPSAAENVKKRCIYMNKKSPAPFPIICKYHAIKLSLQHIDFNSLKYHEKLFTHLAMLLAAGPRRHAAGTDAVGVERDL